MYKMVGVDRKDLDRLYKERGNRVLVKGKIRRYQSPRFVYVVDKVKRRIEKNKTRDGFLNRCVSHQKDDGVPFLMYRNPKKVYMSKKGMYINRYWRDQMKDVLKGMKRKRRIIKPIKRRVNETVSVGKDVVSIRNDDNELVESGEVTDDDDDSDVMLSELVEDRPVKLGVARRVGFPEDREDDEDEEVGRVTVPDVSRMKLNESGFELLGNMTALNFTSLKVKFGSISELRSRGEMINFYDVRDIAREVKRDHLFEVRVWQDLSCVQMKGDLNILRKKNVLGVCVYEESSGAHFVSLVCRLVKGNGRRICVCFVKDSVGSGGGVRDISSWMKKSGKEYERSRDSRNGLSSGVIISYFIRQVLMPSKIVDSVLIVCVNGVQQKDEWSCGYWSGINLGLLSLVPVVEIEKCLSRKYFKGIIPKGYCLVGSGLDGLKKLGVRVCNEIGKECYKEIKWFD